MDHNNTRESTYEKGPHSEFKKYIALTRNGDPYLDARRFEKLGEYRNRGAAPNSYHVIQVAILWARCWLHSGGRMAGGTDTITDGPFESPYVRAWEEISYVLNLAALL